MFSLQICVLMSIAYMCERDLTLEKGFLLYLEPKFRDLNLDFHRFNPECIYIYIYIYIRGYIYISFLWLIHSHNSRWTSFSVIIRYIKSSSMNFHSISRFFPCNSNFNTKEIVDVTLLHSILQILYGCSVQNSICKEEMLGNFRRQCYIYICMHLNIY